MDFSSDAPPLVIPPKNKLEKCVKCDVHSTKFKLIHDKFKGRFRSMNKIIDDKKVPDYYKNIFLVTSSNLEAQYLKFKLVKSLCASFFTMFLFMLFSFPLHF